MMPNLDDKPIDDWLPGPEVTQALYVNWRNARRGCRHAERMSNPVWDWLIRTRISAYTANHHFHGPDSLTAGPAWCFSRFGCSRTELPDGRTLFVAGEHEDSYDPDFFIYNDVIVCHPDESIEIYGYPEDDFPPTDFHSATLVGDRLILIGNLGYVHNRRVARTQVLSLDIRSLRVEEMETTGENPGWIFQHSATFEDNGILVRRGEIDGGETCLENIDDWLLDLGSLRWNRLTSRQWPRFEFIRQDGEMNRLWQIRHELDMRRLQFKTTWAADFVEAMRDLVNPEIPMDSAAAIVEHLYRPAIAHDIVPIDTDNFDGCKVHRINVDGVIVRYVEDFPSVVLTVEGELPAETLDYLAADLRTKLSHLEGVEYVVHRR